MRVVCACVVVVTAFVFVFGVCGCLPDVEPLPIEPGCNPILHGVECGLPYPSDFFLVDDDALPSKKRVQIDAPAKLVALTGFSADVNDFMPEDGFSRQPSIVWTFGVRVNPDSVPNIAADPALTTQKGFPIALIDTSDGSRVPFFVDVDARANDDAREGLVVRPLVRLKELTRYVVAVSGVEGRDGDVPVPEAFARLRGAALATGPDPVLRPLLARYEREIFPFIKDAGIARDALQLAWDFTTGSDDHVTHDMFRARELTLAALERDAPVVAVDSFFDGDEAMDRVFDRRPEISWRFIKLRVTGPRVVDSDDAGAVYFRDAAGDVALNGTTTFDVSVVVPRSVRDGVAPGPVLLYGHGFFGDQGEIEGDATRNLGERSGRVMFALDWQGMSGEDIGTVTASVGDNVAESLRFGERVPQAMMNWLTLTAAIEQGVLNDLTFTAGGVTSKPFRRPLSGPGVSGRGKDSNAGDVIFDDTDVGFMGISQGHILGGVMVALNPAVRRGVFEVGGAGFTHMMFRANPFERFLFLLDLTVPDPLDQQKIAAQFQRAFDRFDPASYAPYILDDEVPFGPPNTPRGRRVMLQMGLGDSSVPNLGTTLHARYLGVPYVKATTVDAPFGLDVVAAPHDGSGFVAYDFGVDKDEVLVADFPEENGVHEGVRRTEPALRQIDAFFHSGVVVAGCDDGPCGPLAIP